MPNESEPTPATSADAAQSDSMFRAMVEQPLAGVYIAQDGVLRYVNPRFAEILGYESPSHTQEEFSGIGIGLATVQRIVDRHGGRIIAEGHVGEGASFCFTLPKSAASK